MKKWLFVLLLLIVLAGSLFSGSVQAQTSTPTSTPDTVEEIEIDGEYFRLDRSITYGEIAVVIASLTVALILIVFVTFEIITHYLM